MPELPEVEVVRAGLAAAVTGARVVAVEVRDPRALKRHRPIGTDGRAGDDGEGGHGATLTPEAGARRGADFEGRLTGSVLGAPVRRGKFVWVPVRSGSVSASGSVPDFLPGSASGAGSRAGSGSASGPGPGPGPGRWALLAHLGMSGQLLLRSHEAPDDRHVRIRLWIEHPEHGDLRLDFADQRLFGSLAIDELVPTGDGAAGGYSGPEMLGGAVAAPYTGAALIPGQARHIARDALDPAFDDAIYSDTVRARASGIKSLLLDQTLMSGAGNIYADEALWRARVHPDTPGRRIGAGKLGLLLGELRAVLAQALAEGGTSFDAQYVNVNGQAGYFSRSLQAYGRTGEPCRRCGTPIRRIVIGGRSSHFCPRCQRRGTRAQP